MRALSIRQPWAWAILRAGKDVENRPWATPWRGLLVVHAGRLIDLPAVAALSARHELPPLERLPVGSFVGLVRMVEVHHASDCVGCSTWAEPDAWHWRLTDPIPLPRPVPARGRLGLRRPEPAVVELARRLAARGGER